MASKTVYYVVAALGIAAASGAAWLYQHPFNPFPTPSISGQPNTGNRNPSATGKTDAAGKSDKAGGAARGTGAAPTVEVGQVQEQSLADEAQTVGSLRSRQSVVIRPEVGGRITQLNFRDGDRVRKGQLLVQLDDQLQRAQVQQSQAELSIAQANHRRNQELATQGFISQRSVDESAANLQVAQAKLALSEASAARMRITAPFDGMTGIRTANIGDYLKDGSDIVNLEDVDVLYVDFRLPERFQAKLRRGQRAIVDVDALAGQQFEAVVQAIDPLLDANGRSVAVRGCIDNRQLHLRPGMFARVNAVFGTRQSALVVPEEAIVPQGARLFVLRLDPQTPQKPGMTTQRVEVQVGLRRPGWVEVAGDLKRGDLVVTAGQQRVQRDGTVVKVVDVPQAAADTAPLDAPTAVAAKSVEKPATKPAANPCDVGAGGHNPPPARSAAPHPASTGAS